MCLFLIPMIGAAAGMSAAAIATATTVATVAGATLTAYGAYQQAQGQKSQAKYNAAVQENNARVAEFKAEDAQDRAQTDAENVGRQQAAVRGKQRAQLAANGLDLSSGTPLSVQEQTDYYGLKDQKTATDNGAREAWGLRSQRDSYSAESQMQRNTAKSISPFGALATSLLGSSGKIADRWLVNNPTSGGSKGGSFGLPSYEF